MSEQENEPDQGELDELATLKMRAKTMGITHSNNITAKTLRKMISDKMEAGEPEGAADVDTLGDVVTNEMGISAAPSVAQITPRQTMIQQAKALVRCRITNMDPKKADLQGEIFTVANEYIGVVRRFVPFGEVTDNGWHVEKCIFDMMADRRFVQVKVNKIRGREETTYHDAREFSLDILPPLTPVELKQMVTSQAAEGAV